ncbi:hypothetical protein FGG78_40330, partial [Thioclava sp. BHET1]
TPKDTPQSAVLGEHPYGLVAAPDHPLVKRGCLSAHDLSGQTFVAREPGSATRLLMDRFLQELDETMTIERIEMPLNEAIKQAVMAGIGIAFLSLHTVSEELRSGRIAVLPAPGLPLRMDWHLFWPLERKMRPVAEHLRDEIVKLNGSFLPDSCSFGDDAASLYKGLNTGLKVISQLS